MGYVKNGRIYRCQECGAMAHDEPPATCERYECPTREIPLVAAPKGTEPELDDLGEVAFGEPELEPDAED